MLRHLIERSLQKVSDTAQIPPKAFSNIRIRDPNTFLCAENAMNVQARESVCRGKKLYRRPETIQQNFSKLLYSRFRHSNHRIGAHTCANHTVPYGTALLGWRRPRHFVPGYDRTVPPGHFATALARSNPKRGNGRSIVSWSAARKASFLCCRTFKAVELGFSVARPFFVRLG